MIPLIFWTTYLTGAFVLSIFTMRYAAARLPYCHRESRSGAGYKWGESNCYQYCKRGCWRTDTHISANSARFGLLALAWPILLLPALAWVLADSKPINPPKLPIDLDRRIDELEKLNGMGKYNDLR